MKIASDAGLPGGVAPRLSAGEVTYLLAFAARDRQTFLAALPVVQPDLFTAGAETHFVLFWQGVTRAAAANGGTLSADPLAARDQVMAACQAELVHDPAGLFYPNPVRAAILNEGGLVYQVFGPDFAPADDARPTALKLLGRFLVERKLADRLLTTLAGLEPGTTLADPAAVLAAFEKSWASVAATGADPGAGAVTDDPLYRPPLPTLIPTGCPWLDIIMNGGQAAGEAYTVLGGTGSGKTSLANQLFVEGGLYQEALAADGGEAGYWYYFSWELNKHDLMQRVYSYGAHVHADTYRRNQPFSTAADPDSLKDYEREYDVNPPGRPPRGEQERLRDFATVVRGSASRLVIVDYSGSVPGAGLGGLDEAIQYLRMQRARGRKVAGAIVDYAGICLSRMIRGNKAMSPSDEFVLLNGFVDQARFQMAIPFACPVWVVHQFHGDQAGRAPGIALHHKDARGSRNIGDNADFCHNIGNHDKTTGLLAFSTSKTRRAPGRTEPLILRFDGRFGRFHVPSGSYEIDKYTKQIVDAASAAAIAVRGPSGGTPPVDPRGGL